MAIFVRKLWKDFAAQHPNRRRLVHINGDLYDAELAVGTVIEEGNKFEASEFNDLEGRIESAFNSINSDIERAETAATNAETSETNAENYSLKAEGYAVGKQNGIDVSQDSPYYHNDAKWNKEQAYDYMIAAQGYSQDSSSSAATSSSNATSANSAKEVAISNGLISEGFAMGTQNGVPVGPESPYYHNNSKWNSDHSQTTQIDITPILSEGTKIAEFEINGVSGDIYAPQGGSSVASEVHLIRDEWASAPEYSDYTNYFYNSVGNVDEYLNGCTKDSGNIPINSTVVYDVPTGWNQIQFNIIDSTILSAIAGKTIEFGACTYNATFETVHYFTVRYKDGEGDHYLFLDTTGEGSENFLFNTTGVALTLTIPNDCEYISVYYVAGTHAPISTAGKLTLTNIYAFDINEFEMPDIYNTKVTFSRYANDPNSYLPNTVNFVKDGTIKVVDNLGGVTTYCKFALLSYGHSTWSEFISAYNTNSIVYCRASSNSNPGTGSQTRLAFMAYVNNVTNPTEVEFQYYRSVQSHSDNQQGDQVFVYKLTSANGGTWTVTTRNSFTKIVAGTGLSSSYSNGVLTLIPSSAISGVWTTPQTASVGATSITITNSAITSSSIIDVKTQNSAGTPIVVESIVATTGSVTITFEELEYATDFMLWIRNI